MKFKIFENLTLKLVALILAIIIWSLVVGEKRSEVRLTVPLELRNLPARLEITEQTAAQVEVTVRGFSSAVKQLAPDEIDVYIDLSSVVEGPNSFALFPEDIRMPVGATVLQVSPSHIDIILEAVGDKAVAVKPMTRGIPADGYSLEKVTTEPKVVTITGSRRILNTITQIETEQIAVDNITQDMVKKAKLKLPAGVRIEKEEERTVSVSIPVTPKMTDVFIENIPLTVGEDEKRQYTLAPQTIAAVIHGPELELSKMSPNDIPVVIETQELPEGLSTVQPIFKLPESMTVKLYYPKPVTIDISKEEKKPE